jgi:hypothetical protein
MTTQDKEFSLEFSRRKLLAAAGIGGGAVLAPYVIGTRGAAAAPDTRGVSDLVPASLVAGLHLQFGADASSEMVVSWHTLQRVRNAQVLLGLLNGKLEIACPGIEKSNLGLFGSRPSFAGAYSHFWV